MRRLLPLALVTVSMVAVGCAEPPRRHYVEERVVYVAPPPPRPVYSQPAVTVVEDAPDAPAAAASVEVVAGPEVEPAEFHEQLSPYGRWVQVEDYGDCWVPNAVEPGWQPYSVGYWVHTRYGWTWVSEERWGYATYHYGRWHQSERYGWVWVPGRTWGPAWVAWRSGDGYCGWAPLPPRRGVEVVVFTSRDSDDIPASRFVFCESRYVGGPHLREHYVPASRNVTIINRTTNITNITIVNSRVVSHGVSTREVEMYSGRRVETVNVRTVTTLERVRTVHDRELAHDLARDRRAAEWDEAHAKHVAEHEVAHEKHVEEHAEHLAAKDTAQDKREQEHAANVEAKHEKQAAAAQATEEKHEAAQEKQMTEKRQRDTDEAAARDRRVAAQKAAKDKRAAAAAAARAKDKRKPPQSQDPNANAGN